MRAVALLLVGLLMAGCGGQDGGWVFASHQRKAAERLLGTPLPAGAQDVRFHRHQHGGQFGDVEKYSAYLKFRASHSDYLEFMHRLEIVVLPGSAPELRARLPGDWKLASGLRLDWWDPTLDIPDDTGMGSFGVNGFIVSKHERGFVYVKASDIG
ncbi:MAG: hypothetical protein ACRDTT_17250 [Pseudonocardiaceae bacterium]